MSLMYSWPWPSLFLGDLAYSRLVGRDLLVMKLATVVIMYYNMNAPFVSGKNCLALLSENICDTMTASRSRTQRPESRVMVSIDMLSLYLQTNMHPRGSRTTRVAMVGGLDRRYQV